MLINERPSGEKEQELLEKISSIFKYSFMDPEERSFLTSLILDFKPKKYWS